MSHESDYGEAWLPSAPIKDVYCLRLAQKEKDRVCVCLCV